MTLQIDTTNFNYPSANQFFNTAPEKLTDDRKFGRLPAKQVALGDLTHYLTETLPAPPAKVAAPHLDYPMAGNDNYGDCELAAVVHTDQALSKMERVEYTYPGDAAVIAQYFEMTGGADTGLVTTNVLSKWHTDGLFGHTIAAWVPVHMRHQTVLKQCIALTGSFLAGVAISQSTMDLFDAGPGHPWDVTGTADDSNILGLHEIPALGYNAIGPVFVSWGSLKQATWRWWNEYCDESHVVITDEVKNKNVFRGVNFAQLDADLAALKSN